MADCKDIDAALDRLSSKIDGLGNRLNSLETKQKECCDKKEQKPRDVDLEPLIKRIGKLENYVTSLESGLTNIFNFTKSFQTLLRTAFR